MILAVIVNALLPVVALLAEAVAALLPAAAVATTLLAKTTAGTVTVTMTAETVIDLVAQMIGKSRYNFIFMIITAYTAQGTAIPRTTVKKSVRKPVRMEPMARTGKVNILVHLCCAPKP